jgi:hypothetical protein
MSDISHYFILFNLLELQEESKFAQKVTNYAFNILANMLQAKTTGTFVLNEMNEQIINVFLREL